MEQQIKNVNLEQQGMLAKLLAKENIRIQHGNFTTAFFEVKTRVLGLPMWEDKGKAVYDLLCGHEVGHALFTPSNGHEIFRQACPGIPFDVCNVVEDVRIERMIQDTYPGLSASFRQAYSKLAADNFFGVKDKDLSKLGIIDRINIHAKTRGIIPVPLSAEETAIYDRAYAAQSFEDVIEVCKDLAKLAPKSKQQNSTEGGQEQSQDQQDAPTGQEQATNKPDENAKIHPTADLEESQDEAKDSQSQQSDSPSAKDTTSSSDAQDDAGNSSSTTASSKPSQQNSQLVSETLKAFEQAIREMTVNDPNTGFFTQPPMSQVDRSVIPFKKILADRQLNSRYSKYMKDAGALKHIADIRSRSKKYVTTLTNEFNMRKAAYQYSRASESRTGTLNVNRLHSYKYADDIFKSITKLADAKNHGMVFFVDMSSSMCSVIGDVLEHTVNLVLFCRSLSIPFQVYGFTTRNHDSQSMANAFHGELILSNLSLTELFSSAMSKSEFDLAINQTCAQIAWHAGHRVDTHGYYNCPVKGPREIMDGTPLLECIVAAHSLIKRFRQQNPIQKMTAMFLTDGKGFGMYTHHHDEVAKHCTGDNNRWGSQFVGTLNGRRITLSPHNFDDSYHKLILSLRATCDCTAISFFLPANKNLGQRTIQNAIEDMRFHKLDPKLSNVVARQETLSKLYTQYKKDNCVEISGAYGFNAYYVLGGIKEIAIDDEESFDPDFAADVKVTVGRLATAFSKFNSGKRNSRILLNKFAKQIA